MIEISQVQAALSVVLGNGSAVVPDTDYRIVGTAAALLHGVQLPAGDIDVLLKTRVGVDAFSAALSAWSCLSPPTYLEGSRQYFASYDIEGVKVEFSTVEWPNESDTSECTGRGPWVHYSLVPCGPRRVPVVALELRLLSELARGRADRYAPIWEFMQLREYDSGLVARGLREKGITEADWGAALGLLHSPGDAASDREGDHET